MKKLRYCEQCGNALPDGVRFCENCGAPLSDAQLRENAHENAPERVFTPRRTENRAGNTGERRNVPEGRRPRPDGVQNAPEGRRPRPDGIRNVPEGRKLHPDGVQNTPEGRRLRPDGVRNVPENRRLRPDAGQNPPEERQIKLDAPHNPEDGRRRPQETPSGRPDSVRRNPRNVRPEQRNVQNPRTVRPERANVPRQPEPERYYQDPRRMPYQQPPVQPPQWEPEFEEEEERRFTPFQSVLLVLIGLLAVALVVFLIYWGVGRTRSRDTADRQHPQEQQTGTVQKDSSDNKDAITILDGAGTSGETTAQSETQKPTEKQTEKPTEKMTEKPTEKPTEKQTELPDIQVIDPNQPQSGNTSAQGASGEYILSGSSERPLSDADVAGLSYDDMQMAINEIYARHGRKFATASINDYFQSKSWYQGTLSADEFSESVFSQVEWQNIQFLLQKMGIE